MQEETRQGKKSPGIDNQDSEMELFPSFLTASSVTPTNAEKKDSLASIYYQSPFTREESISEDREESKTAYEEHPGELLQTLFSGLKGRETESTIGEHVAEKAKKTFPTSSKSIENNGHFGLPALFDGLKTTPDDFRNTETSQYDSTFNISEDELNSTDQLNDADFEDGLNFITSQGDRKNRESLKEPEDKSVFDENFNDLEIAQQLEELENRLGFEIDLSNLEITKQPNIFENDLNFADSLLEDLGNIEQIDKSESTTELETQSDTLGYPFNFNEQNVEELADPFPPFSIEPTTDDVDTLLLNRVSTPAFMPEAQTVKIAQNDSIYNVTNMVPFANINNNQRNHPFIPPNHQGFTTTHKRPSARLVSLIAAIVAFALIASLVFVLNKGNSTGQNKEPIIAGHTISIDVGKPTGLLTPTNVATPLHPGATPTGQPTAPSSTSVKSAPTASGGSGNTQSTTASQTPTSNTSPGSNNTTGSGTTAPPAGSSSPPTTGPSTQPQTPAPPPPVFTSFTGGNNGSYDTNVNLTSIGSIDWSHWGYPNAGNVTNMNGGTNVISSVSWNSAITNDNNQSNDFTWSNGTSPTSANALTSGTDIKGGNASFTVKTSPVQHTLRVYVGAYLAQGTLTITLNGKTAYSGSWDMSHDSSNQGDNTLFTFSYQTNVDSQFTVTYAMTKTDGSSSYIMLEAAAVS